MAVSTESGAFMPFPSRRSVVHSTEGIVSCTCPLAAQAGLRVLRRGGNAADAAVAVAAVLNVTDPSMTGIGGDIFCLFYEATTKKVHALNGSGRSPAAVTLEGVCEALGATDPATASVPKTSVHAVTIPGAAAGWVDTVERFGSGVLSLAEILAPAVELATAGYPVSQISAEVWKMTEDELKSTSPYAHEVLKADPSAPGGYRAPQEGEIVTNWYLANTLRLLGEQGKKGFYEGPVARAIVAATKAKGGFHALEDLAYHAEQGSEITEAVPLKLGNGIGPHDPVGEESSSLVKNTVDGVTLWEHPPNGQGIVAQIALGIIQELERTGKINPLTELKHNSAAYIHIIVEALRIAFADASYFVTDRTSMPIDARSLLAPAYLSERAKLFDPLKASRTDSHGDPPPHSDTVYFAVTDPAGNACSFVNSVADRFGSCIIPPGTGFALQNRGCGFRLDATHPNAYGPRKRAYNTIIPAMLTNTADGSLNTAFGVMGGLMQPQGHVQVLLNMLVFGFSPQVALDAPRVCVGVNVPGKAIDPTKTVDWAVYVEEGVDAEAVKGLEEMGHEVKIVEGHSRALFGRGQVIRVSHDSVTGTRVYSAGSDPRGDGAAVPLLTL